jgi:hypothetical protein
MTHSRNDMRLPPVAPDGRQHDGAENPPVGGALNGPEHEREDG